MSLYVTDSGRVIERRREPEANRLFQFLMWFAGLTCVLIAIFNPF